MGIDSHVTEQEIVRYLNSQINWLKKLTWNKPEDRRVLILEEILRAFEPKVEED